MSYLLDFILTFDEREMLLFKKLDLKGKEEVLRDIYVHESKRKGWQEAAILAEMNISQAHLDKMNSVLLDKTISAMFGEDFDRAFYVILQKGLSSLMLHEVKILERKILALKSDAEKVKFYKAAFDNLRRMYHPNYDSLLTREFGRKYLQSLGNEKTIADESYVEMTALHGDILVAHRSGNEENEKPKVQAELEKWAKYILPSGNYEARFYYAYALLTFRKNMGDSVQEFLEACELAYESYENCDGKVDARFKGVVLSELAFGYAESNRFAEAEKYYALAINEFPDTIARSIFHAGNYIIICLINENYGRAREFFDSHAAPKIQPNANPSMMLDVYILGILLNMHTGKLDEAFKYINAMNNYRKSEVTEYGKVILRMLQPLYFAILGDYKTADSLVKSSDKYLGRAIKKASAFNYYFKFNNILGKIVKMELGGRGSIDKIRQQIDALQKGIYVVNNSLLYRLLNAGKNVNSGKALT